MCGFAGVAGAAPAPDAAILLATLDHRGPDGHGIFTGGDGSGSVLHTRLAINDLSPAGDQPLYNQDRTLALMFNGEIYDSPDLRRSCEANGHHFASHSDGEVILHLWEDLGEEALNHLNGIFAFALSDARTGQLVLARDPLGVKPLFWAHDGESIWFASELRALKATGAPMGALDPVALAQFLTFLWVPDPRTPFSGARSVPPGHLVCFRAGRAELRRYSDVVLEGEADDALDIASAKAELRDVLGAAVRRQLLADVPIALMASGGIDSSLLWWAAGEGVDRAFTIRWESGVGEGLAEDTHAVEELHSWLGTHVTYIDGADADPRLLLPSGDLFADPAVDLCRRIAERTRADGYKVLLSGQGGDELFGGYRRHVLGPRAAARSAPGAAAAAALITRTGLGGLRGEYGARLLRALGRRDPLASYMTLCTYSEPRDRAQILGCTEAEVSDETVWAAHREVFDRTPASWSLLRRFRAIDLAVYLPGLGLAYADRAGMHHSVEVRVPFLDLEVVRFAQRLPDRLLMRGLQGKVLPKALARDILPRSVVNRPKRGFAVPATQLQDEPVASSRGYRQARYLATAAAVLEEWREVAR